MAVSPFSITENINDNATTLPTIKTAYCSSSAPHKRIVGCHVPIILSLTYALRFLLWAWQLDSACNTVRYFTMSILTLPHYRRTLRTTHFYALLSLDPYIRSFVRRSRHSYHMHFIDPRPIGYTVHLWTAFVLFTQITVSLSRLHRAFDKADFSTLPIGVSGEAFQGVTLSFHFSDYQFS